MKAQAIIGIVMVAVFAVSSISLWVALSVQAELHKVEMQRQAQQISLASGGDGKGDVDGKHNSKAARTLKKKLHEKNTELRRLKMESANNVKELRETNTLLNKEISEVKAKAKNQLVENFYVSTRAAALLDTYEDQISTMRTTGIASAAYLPVLDEPKGLTDPSALDPGPDWWNRPNRPPGAPKTMPENWKKEDPKIRKQRIAKISKVISTATQEAGTTNNPEQWRKFTDKAPSRPPEKAVNGIGVVIAGGGPVYFSSAWVIVRQLRAVGCYLPVEIWVTAGEVVDAEVQKKMEAEGISIEDATDLLSHENDGTGQAERVASGMDKRFPLKAIALVYSKFRHVISLDADNFPAHNPERLLRSGGYVRTGALFWPDFWPLESSNAIWDHIKKPFQAGMQQESGQLMIDKQQHWRPLLLALHMNLESAFYYTMLQGDKDTFQFSWRALDAPFTMMPIYTGSGGVLKNTADGYVKFYGHTMVQFDVYQRPMFFHKNLKKWTTGLRPTATYNLTNTKRDWHMIKSCKPHQGHMRNPYACRGLVDWIDGFITFKNYADHASSASFMIQDAVGYDLEGGILTGFKGLWKMPEYDHYVTTNFGPAGNYLWSCKACKMLTITRVLSCECRGPFVEGHDDISGHVGPWITSTLDDPHDCDKAGFEVYNNKGYLACSGSPADVKRNLKAMRPDSTRLKATASPDTLEASQFPAAPSTKAADPASSPPGSPPGAGAGAGGAQPPPTAEKPDFRERTLKLATKAKTTKKSEQIKKSEKTQEASTGKTTAAEKSSTAITSPDAQANTAAADSVSNAPAPAVTPPAAVSVAAATSPSPSTPGTSDDDGDLDDDEEDSLAGLSKR